MVVRLVSSSLTYILIYTTKLFCSSAVRNCQQPTQWRNLNPHLRLHCPKQRHLPRSNLPKTFRVPSHSTPPLLGKLPNELLQNIVRHLYRSYLLAVTLVSSRLRALAERRLYTNIIMPYIPGRDEYCTTQGEKTWYLYGTLSARSDLAARVKVLDLMVVDLDHAVNLPPSTFFTGGLPFTSDLEPLAAGALLQHLTELDFLVLCLGRATDELIHSGSEELMLGCMGKVFPGFDAKTAHFRDLPMLRKVEHMDFHGDEFHWIMARGPNLWMLRLMNICTILADAAPEEITPSLKYLSMEFRSSVLNPSIGRYDDIVLFLEQISVPANPLYRCPRQTAGWGSYRHQR